MSECGNGTPPDDAVPARPSAASRLGRRLPGLVGLVIFVIALYVLHRALAGVSVAEVAAGLRAIAPAALVGAALLTVVNYALQTLYDLIGLRYVGSALRWRTIAPHAFCAMAVGHNVGVSALSGGAIRYRAYAAMGLPTADIARIIACYPLTYALGAATLLGLVLTLAPAAAPGGAWLGDAPLRLVGLALLALVPLAWLFWAARVRRPLAFGRWRLAAPTPRLAAAQIALGVADILVTATVLYLLMPAIVDIGFVTFLGRYVIAVTIGSVSGVPGGVGVVEGSMLVLMPEVAASALIGALLAWRVIYFLVPLAVALAVLAWQLARERGRAPSSSSP